MVTTSTPTKAIYLEHMFSATLKPKVTAALILLLSCVFGTSAHHCLTRPTPLLQFILFWVLLCSCNPQCLEHRLTLPREP